MPQLPYTITSRSVTVMVGSRVRTLDASALNYSALVKALREPKHDHELIKDLVSLSSFVARQTHGEVQIAEDEVRWRGTVVHNVVANRLIDLLKIGADLRPLSNFLSKLLLNPLLSARDELYLWLETSNLPITEDGNFLAWKKVRHDYLDIHSGTISYAIGRRPYMSREQVDPDRYKECSSGLHFCSFSYLANFGGRDGSRVMIVEIDPADVVAIPHDYDNAKGRCWRMSVIGEVPEEDCAQFFAGSSVYDGPTYCEVYPADCDADQDEDEDTSDKVSEFGSAISLDEDDSLADIVVDSLIQVTQTFTRGNQTFTAEQIVEIVEEHGQRGFSNITGVPRSTLQDWLKRIMV